MKYIVSILLYALFALTPSLALAHTTTTPGLQEAVANACRALATKLNNEKYRNIRIGLHTEVNHPKIDPIEANQRQTQITNIAFGYLESRNRTLFKISPQPANLEQPHSKVARHQGADYLATFEISKAAENSLLRLQLQQVDRGLWHKADEVSPIIFQESIPFKRSTSPAIVKRKEPSARKLRTVADEVVALTNCELLDDSPGEELLVLTTSELLLFGQRGSFLRLLERYSLESVLTTSSFRSRYPHGFARCTPSSEGFQSIILTQSGYNGMATLSFEESNISNSKFKRHNDKTEVVTGEKKHVLNYSPRRPWFSVAQEKSTLTHRQYLEFTFPKQDKVYTLLKNYSIQPFAEEASVASVKLTSGLGFSAYTNKDNRISFVTTSSIASNGTDHVSIRKEDGTIVQTTIVPGYVKASSLLRNDTLGINRVILAIRAHPKSPFHLYEWEVYE